MKPEEIVVGGVYERRGASRTIHGETEAWVRRRRVLDIYPHGTVEYQEPGDCNLTTRERFARWAHRRVDGQPG